MMSMICKRKAAVRKRNRRAASALALSPHTTPALEQKSCMIHTSLIIRIHACDRMVQARLVNYVALPRVLAQSRTNAARQHPDADAMHFCAVGNTNVNVHELKDRTRSRAKGRSAATQAEAFQSSVSDRLRCTTVVSIEDMVRAIKECLALCGSGACAAQRASEPHPVQSVMQGVTGHLDTTSDDVISTAPDLMACPLVACCTQVPSLSFSRCKF
jgi:hypothetical protein